MGSAATKALCIRPRWSGAWVLMSALLATNLSAAEPSVEFDFARLAGYRVLAATDSAVQCSDEEQLIEVVLPISVRFRGVSIDSVEEIDVEINASDTGLRVASFAPSTQLHSDVVQTIFTTTTTQKARTLEATLGGELPLPVGNVVSHVTPSVTAGLGKSETATEKLSRLPPKEAIVISGTSSQAQGVFFKLKRSSQTSLEGVHEMSVRFVAPRSWHGGSMRVACAAHGQRKVLWMDKPATLGELNARVELYEAGDDEMRESAVRRAQEAPRPHRRPSLIEAAAAELQDAAKCALGDSQS
jgi:hypothetical protein